MDKPRCLLSILFGVGAGIFFARATEAWESAVVGFLIGSIATGIEIYRSNRQREKWLD